MTKDVSIILVNYKTKELTDQCIESIYEKTKDLNFNIYVVDNASFDGIGGLHIGQDGTGGYAHPLPATVDELMIFDGVLDEQEIKMLAEHYGVR